MEAVRPGVEQLDNRILPSTFADQILAETGAGLLRVRSAWNDHPYERWIGPHRQRPDRGPGENRLTVSDDDASGAMEAIGEQMITCGNGLGQGGGIHKDGRRQ